MFELLLLLACKQSSYFKAKSHSLVYRELFSPLSHLNWKYTTILYLGHACVSSTFTCFLTDPLNGPLHKEDKYSYWVRGKAGRTISHNFSPDSHQHLPILAQHRQKPSLTIRITEQRSFYSNKLLPLHDVIQVSKTAWGYVHVRLMASTTPGNFNLSR